MYLTYIFFPSALDSSVGFGSIKPARLNKSASILPLTDISRGEVECKLSNYLLKF